MANASVDKLKELGLRHGEKVVMGLATGVSLLLLFSAATVSTIDTTPEAVRKAADAADANLKTRQESEDILKRLEESGDLKNADFEKLVDAQAKDRLDPVAFKVRSPWITSEPGGGLIRDTPVLIAATDLHAFPGRGSALVFELDENGERIPDTSKTEADIPQTPRRLRSRRRPMNAPMAGMQGKRRRRGKSAAQIEAEQKKQQEFEEKRRKGQLVGKDAPKTDADKDAEANGTPEAPPKEITKGLRWVAITGVLDHKKLRENYLQALKNPAIAQPHFKQLDVERQVLQSDGSWSEWEAVDSERNWEIVDNLPEEEEELTPESVRLDALVDPLPFLKSGYWERVHVASLVPEEAKNPTPTPGAFGGAGMMMDEDGGGRSAQMGRRGGGMMGGRPGMMGGKSGMMGARMPASAMMGDEDMGGMMGRGGMGMGFGSTETINFPTSDEDTLMLRSLDFTVEPDKTYKFRVRIVVFNPNRGHEDVNAGVDTKSIELFGPWSEPTDEVTMPADVAAYAMHSVPATGKMSDEIQFQVARWAPDSGVTVVKNFSASPGGFIGDMMSVEIPTTDGTTQKKRSKIDFDTHKLVLDTKGGSLPYPKGLGTPGRLEIPSLSLLVRNDGSVIVRNQANDVHDEVRKTIETNAKRELDESGKQRESSMGSYSGMMGPMGSMGRMGPMGGRR